MLCSILHVLFVEWITVLNLSGKEFCPFILMLLVWRNLLFLPTFSVACWRGVVKSL